MTLSLFTRDRDLWARIGHFIAKIRFFSFFTFLLHFSFSSETNHHLGLDHLVHSIFDSHYSSNRSPPVFDVTRSPCNTVTFCSSVKTLRAALAQLHAA
ncbi:hypothetical protein BDV34DRAFT_186277 [Aspergillus parasiticus]|uniref:Uncharacterized protein n=1 Tax=Aspergillus parasiticus TaxID=5067 RepID=A0A5N6E0I2_ASPPA|nr:hypothetical protein BDV34DRAFT_186277 [Aspergillus parasiticus]